MNKRLWCGIADALALPEEIPSPETLGSFEPRLLERYAQQAAVMLLLTDESSPQLLFTLRAQHLTYHAGEVCFPGGMWEPQDSTLLASALRETEEEIGLSSTLIDVLGVLPMRMTRRGTAVTPFVARIPPNCCFKPNLNELDEVFTVPLEKFAEGLQIREDVFERDNKHYRTPAYAYQGYEIWGFTAAVTADLLALSRPFL